MQPQQALLRAIELCDGQVNFAKLLSAALIAEKKIDKPISQQLVSYWTRSAKGAPAEYCTAIEELPHINFKVTKTMLRPDVFEATPYKPLTEDIHA